MGAKKNRKQKRPNKPPVSQRRLLVPALLIGLSMVVIGAGGWLFSNGSEPKAGSEAAAARQGQAELSQPASRDVLAKLVGRWRRPDGGYLLEILAADADGTLKAAYYNPRPIHVSQARVTFAKDGPQIFIELNDVGYPGATYALRFHVQQEVLEGVYYQPAVSQAFNVVFGREKS